MGAGVIIGIIVILIIIWLIVTYNGFIKARNSVEEGFSTMDVYLKKRFDLIPNLVETVKGYAKHEKETLENITAARTKISNASSIEERAAGENQLTGALKTLFAVAEAYPDLKANTNFLNLQGQLQQVEQDIANSRKYYNAVVKKYNNKCEMFPSSIIARLFNFTRRAMFEVGSEAERQNVNVQF
ncbi:MAG: LemA family protein [Eubacterium sp.]|nr:LemA family protein [Eubacterium sp.]